MGACSAKGIWDRSGSAYPEVSGLDSQISGAVFRDQKNPGRSANCFRADDPLPGVSVLSGRDGIAKKRKVVGRKSICDRYHAKEIRPFLLLSKGAKAASRGLLPDGAPGAGTLKAWLSKRQGKVSALQQTDEAV